MAQPGSQVPQLSIVVPAWNAASSIGRAVSSVLDQTDVPLECIVVDDASTDETAAIVAGMAERDGRVVLISSAVNEGASAARNRALDVARGEWLGFLDADDRLLPGGLGAMLRAADAHDALAVVGQRISTDGERTWVPVLYDLPDIREPGVKSIARNPGLLYYAGPVGKLFHRSLTEGLRFEGRLLGDQPWIVRAMLRAGDRIVVIADWVYEWRRPHPSQYAPTLTTSRERSARLGAEAVAMAAVAYATVVPEIERTVEPAARRRLEVAYFERLIRADLTAQLSAAVRRGDEGLGEMFAALESFITAVPPEVVAGSFAVARDVIEPPLRRWPRVPAAARPRYWTLFRTALAVDPALPGRASGRLAAAGLRLGAGLPAPVGHPAAALLVMASRVATRLRRAPAARPPAGTAAAG